MKDAQYLLNRSAKYLARSANDYRHFYSPDGVQRRSDQIAEAWRFPIIDSYGGGAKGVSDPAVFSDYNEVTFIYAGESETKPASVAVLGSFHNLYESIPLERVLFQGEPTRYWALTFVVPKGQSHIYRFLIDGIFQNDPVNPQLTTLENGAVWSRFFTEEFTEPLVLERWEIRLLYRLVETIAPFRSDDAEDYLRRYYNSLDRETKLNRYNNAYRLDASVGEVNFIDNLLAREERHRLVDYKICLSIIDQVLRQRNPYIEPFAMSSELYDELYDQMVTGNVPGWDTQRYGSPQFFLYLLRRHTAMGAFSHPKYGGNTGGAGWAYLAERFGTPSADPTQPASTLFNWRRALEQPLGTNADYLG